MVNSHARLTDLADTVRRLLLRPNPGTRYSCDECGARVSQPCADPYCYGSLGDPPSSARPVWHRR